MNDQEYNQWVIEDQKGPFIELVMNPNEYETFVKLKTLQNVCPQSQLGQMFEDPSKLQRDEKGQIILDSDGDAFMNMIHYLENGNDWEIQELNGPERTKFLDELKIWKIAFI